MTIKHFLRQSMNGRFNLRQWFPMRDKHNVMEIYLRRCERLPPKSMERLTCVDVATLNVSPITHSWSLPQKATILREYFDWLRNIEPVAAENHRMIFVENIMQQSWLPHYNRLGYQLYREDEVWGLPCLYKLI